MSHWLYQSKVLQEAPENAFGFIYKITNSLNGKMYIGRKYFEKKRRVKRKGQSRRKVIRKSSKLIKKNGTLILEIGFGQKNKVLSLLPLSFSLINISLIFLFF